MNGCRSEQLAQAARPDAARERERCRPRTAKIGLLERAVHGGGFGREGQETTRLGRTGEIADRLGRPLELSVQVETLPGSPGMAGEQSGPSQFQMRGQRTAGPHEQFLEHPAHRQDGRSAVDAHAVDEHFAQLAPGHGGAFVDLDLDAACSQVDGRGQAADACSDHDHPSVTHAPSCVTLTTHGHVSILTDTTHVKAN